MVSIKPKFFFLFLISSIMAALTACGTASKVVTTPTSDGLTAIQTDMEKYNQCLSQMNADCIASLFAPHGQIFDTGLISSG